MPSAPTPSEPVAHPAGPFVLTMSRYAGGCRQPPHAHEAAQITILLRGAIREVVEGRHENGTPLSMVVKPPGVRHSDEIGPGGARTLQIAFAGVFAERLAAAGTTLGRWRWMHAGPAVRTMLALAAEYDAAGPLDAALLEDRVWDVLGTIGEDGGGRERHPSPALRRVKERIDDGDGLSVRALAREARLHPASLTRAFRRSYGTSVVSYRTRQRFRRAAEAIASGGCDLTRLAHEHGYADQAHLCRDFRRRAGLTPSGYSRLVARV
ncbi:MAG TPA: helix-turn-helix domain-containing protein [Thermoanaerobaculia bacterium]|jgi:AraC family transcriptional regulator|nr:helix-turn-helix domain-containing protein [Thermoanaerobaculia bacterium]